MLGVEGLVASRVVSSLLLLATATGMLFNDIASLLNGVLMWMLWFPRRKMKSGERVDALWKHMLCGKY